MYTVDFRMATDRLTRGCPTLADVAGEAGVSAGLIRQARMDPKASSFRNPPLGWELVLAKLARKRSRELEKLAGELEG